MAFVTLIMGIAAATDMDHKTTWMYQAFKNKKYLVALYYYYYYYYANN